MAEVWLAPLTEQTGESYPLDQTHVMLTDCESYSCSCRLSQMFHISVMAVKLEHWFDSPLIEHHVD